MTEEFLDYCFEIYKGYKKLKGKFMVFETLIKLKETEHNIAKATVLQEIKDRIKGGD